MIKRKLTKAILLIIVFSACSLDKPKYSENVVKDFNLGWWSDTRHTALFLNNDHTEYGGREIVPETVAEIGYNQDFIIVKQHPNMFKEIEDRVLSNETETGYEIKNAADTVYLPEEFVFSENGSLYLKKQGRDELDYLFPYRDVTYYYIIDIRNYRLRFWAMDGNVFRFDNEIDFQMKRLQLAIPGEVTFTHVDISDESE
jgi:hypothetical protein